MFLRSFPSLVLKSLSWRMLMHGTVIDGNGNLAYMHLQHTLLFPAQCGKPFLGTTILTVWPLGSRDRSRQLQKIETNHSCFQEPELEQHSPSPGHRSAPINRSCRQAIIWRSEHECFCILKSLLILHNFLSAAANMDVQVSG